MENYRLHTGVFSAATLIAFSSSMTLCGNWRIKQQHTLSLIIVLGPYGWAICLYGAWWCSWSWEWLCECSCLWSWACLWPSSLVSSGWNSAWWWWTSTSPAANRRWKSAIKPKSLSCFGRVISAIRVMKVLSTKKPLENRIHFLPSIFSKKKRLIYASLWTKEFWR